MKLDRVVQILKKVNALVENLDDQGQTSAIEKDLLKRYLRDLYEHVSEADSMQAGNVQSRPAVIQERENHVPAEPVAESAPEANPVIATEQSEPVFSPEKQTTYYDAESEKVPAEAKVPEPKTEEVAPSPEPTKYFPPEPAAVQHVESTSMPAHEAEADVAVSAVVDESRFARIFSSPDTTDLADKFKLQPIQSIESSMGINQRLQTINELFEGNHNAFVEAIKSLNSVSEFDAAREFLIQGPADQFNWDQDDKVKLASDFVHLVRRKYI